MTAKVCERRRCMRLVLFDPDLPSRRNFYPLALSRPIWELRCGISSLREKLIAKAGEDRVPLYN